MNLILPPRWALPDSVVNPQADYLDRRRFLKILGLGVAALAITPPKLFAATAGFPAKLNPAYRLEDLTLTKENAIFHDNNFIEFSFKKEGPIIEANKGWRTDPWTVEIAGLVDKPRTFDVNELVRKMSGIEQRNYRHRCVEGWAMVIPRDGFPLNRLIKLVEPK